MMPDAEMPHWARRLDRAMNVISYLMAITVALGDAFFPSITLEFVSDNLVLISAVIMGGMGVVGVASSLSRRWRIEWVAAAILMFLLASRAASTWVTVPATHTRLSAAAMMTLGALFMAKRAFSLWVFAAETGFIARRRNAMVARGAATTLERD
jgi:hypothetical protein